MFKGTKESSTDRTPIDNLPFKIQDRLRDSGVERKIYMKVDARAKYGTLKLVLDAVHSAGIENVGFLVQVSR